MVLDDYLLEHLPVSVNRLFISAGDSLKIKDATFVRHLERLSSFSAQRSLLSTQSLFVIVSSCVDLMHLDLSFARLITDFSPIAHLSRLKSLILTGNRENLFDDHLTKIIDGCRHLEVLSLEGCTQLTESGLLSIQRCTHMKSLNLLGQCCITDSPLMAIVHGCRLIEELDITYCTKISKVGLSSVLQLPRLKQLQVSGIREFDTKLAILLSKVLPQCRLTAENCKYSTEREKGFQRKMKNLVPVETAVTAVFRLDD
ncbi:unnamed protein product [Toxocara canis]|uniref:F-box/LRR-repeat protein 15-like leucin rich repeat domain-containing protein n=1 Tax=Toxocara canis TaxID=6265 RepID=A0A3P7GSS3_TOXCA|nr:unnamed protein product [Toxocara canis]